MASQAPATPGMANGQATQVTGGGAQPGDAAIISAGLPALGDPDYAAKASAYMAAMQRSNGGQVGGTGTADPVLFWGSKTAPRKYAANPTRPGGMWSGETPFTYPGTKGVTTNTTVTQTQALLDIYKWSPAKVQKEIAKLRSYGFDVQGNDLQALEPWWKQMVVASEQFLKVHKNVSPFDAPALMGSKAAGDALAQTAAQKAASSGAYSKDSTSSEVDSINPGDAQTILNKSLSEHLGRAATPEEIQDFLSRANALAKADPTVTTKTTDYSAADPVTGMRTQNDRNVSKTGGYGSAGDLAAEANKSANTPEAGAYEAAAFYAPMLFKALASPV